MSKFNPLILMVLSLDLFLFHGVCFQFTVISNCFSSLQFLSSLVFIKFSLLLLLKNTFYLKLFIYFSSSYLPAQSLS